MAKRTPLFAGLTAAFALAACAAFATPVGAATDTVARASGANDAATSTTTSEENCQPAGADHLAYSTNLDTDYDSVSVIDLNQNKVVRYIPGFNVPANVTPVADGSKLYVDEWYAGRNPDTKVVNPCTGQIVKTLRRPGGLFPLTNLSPDGRWLYLTTIQGWTIEKIDTRTDQVVRKYSTLGAVEPIGYAVPDPNGHYMWIAGLHHVFTLDLDTGKFVGRPIAVGLSPQWLAITPDGKRLLATNFVGGTDSIIDAQTRTVISTVNTGLTSYPNSVSATPDSSQFWVGNLDGSVVVADATTGKEIRKLDTGKMMTLDVTFSKDGKYAYVPTVPHTSKAVNLNGAVTAFGFMVTGLFHAGPGEIAVYDTKTYDLVDTFQTGGLPSPVIAPTGPF